jgi:Interferon-induced transmembrane protein
MGQPAIADSAPTPTYPAPSQPPEPRPAPAPGWSPPGAGWDQRTRPDLAGSPGGWARAAAERRRLAASAMTTGVPSNYLWQSLVCLFLFLPSAVVAVVYSTQVNRRVHVGDMTGAVRASRLARMWCVITVIVFTALVLWTMAGGRVP